MDDDIEAELERELALLDGACFTSTSLDVPVHEHAELTTSDSEGNMQHCLL